MKLTLYKPVTPFAISQNFGENLACIDLSTSKVISKVGATCPVGYVDLYESSGLKGHQALDIPTNSWQPVYAAHEGFVEELEADPKRGLGIGIVSNFVYDFIVSPYNDNGVWNAKTRYWHLAAFNIVKGQKVREGQLIGWADSTGYSSGNHLHFELKPVEWNQNAGQWWNVFQENGF